MQSPERLQARLEELAGGVERERGLVADAERRARDLQARMDTIAKVWKPLCLSLAVAARHGLVIFCRIAVCSVLLPLWHSCTVVCCFFGRLFNNERVP